MANETGFDLLHEPWVVVLAPDGRERELSILEVFEGAPGLSMIGGEVSTQAFAITRLLLAFLHRAIDGPEDQHAWAELWEQPALPMSEIREYAERFRHRFDLFHPETPFLQVADLHTGKGEVSGLEKIVADVPNGEPMFTTRSAASLRTLRSAEAARWLVHAHAFDPSGIKSGAVGDPAVKNGKGYPIGTGWCGQLGGLLAQGADLRETLLSRAQRYGFRIVDSAAAEGEPDVAVVDRAVRRFSRNGSRVTLSTATFEGHLTVEDAAALRRSMTSGIGRAKSYGCGLLTLTRGPRGGSP